MIRGGVARGMGAVVLLFATLILLWQSVFVLLQRDESHWGFSLVRHSTLEINRTRLDEAFANPRGNLHVPVPVWSDVLNRVDPQTSLHECVKHFWELGLSSPPSVCFNRGHLPHRTDAVLDEWNPHLLLLAVAGANAIFCLCEAVSRRELVTAQHALAYRRTLGSVCVVVYVVAMSIGSMWVATSFSALRYTTLLLQAAVLLPMIRYAYLVDASEMLPTEDFLEISLLMMVAGPEEHRSNSHVSTKAGGDAMSAWRVSVHQQVVMVPLLVTVWATVGMRSWEDVVSQAALLMVASNALWVKQATVEWGARTVCKVLCVLLPVCSTLLALEAIGGPRSGWRQMVALMAAFALAPFLLLALLPRALVSEVLRVRISLYCITAALMASVVNINIF